MVKTLPKLVATLIGIASTAMLFAQDPIIMEVGGEKITRSEFIKEYRTNVADRMPANATAAERQSALNEYVDLYAIFRAKMLDAHNMGIDTLPSLVAEMNKYRTELAAPYLIDSTALSELMHTEYERNRYSLCAAHILVPCRPDASPEDTVAAYQRAKDYRARLDRGENFFELAAEEVQRSNKSPKVKPNEGYLGYFSVFDMVYQFEDAAYAMKVGEISQPVRTRFGYHIIMLMDRIEMHGNVDMAHIWISSNDSAATRQRIYDIYNKIKDGMPFAEAARMSHDRTTKENGGSMPQASLNNLPPEYIAQLRHMKPGDVSEPFFTKYGWHIIKLDRADTLPPYEKMLPYYKQRMTRDPRGDVSRKAFAKSSRQRYGVIDYTTVPADKRGRKMLASLDELEQRLPDSVQRGIWSGNDLGLTDLRTLVEIRGKKYNAKDFERYIAKTQAFQSGIEKKGYYLRHKYEDFIDSITIAYADSQLENEHPDFAEVIEDYRRGLMIFEYNDRMIWSKAIHDSAGFADYYRRASVTKNLDNPNDSVFFWHEKARVTTFTIADSNTISRKKLQKILDKAYRTGASSNNIQQTIAKAMRTKAAKGESTATVEVETDEVERTRQDILADDQWHTGVYISTHQGGYRAVIVDSVSQRTLKGHMEARGYYLNEYQNEVERNLYQSLREKYNIKINHNVVATIAY